MGSYLSTNTPTDSVEQDENKIEIIVAKFPASASSIIGWNYCLIYPPDEQNVHLMESSTMGILYRSTLSYQETYCFKYLDQPTYCYVYKPSLEGVRSERTKFYPLTDQEQAHMKRVMEGEVEYI